MTIKSEAKALAARFDAVKNRAQFARDNHIPGGGAIIYQHINGLTAISLEAAKGYANGFGVPLSDISQRLAKEVELASKHLSDKFSSAGLAKQIDIESDAEYASVRKVSIRLSAGVVGYAIEHIEEDAPPIVFRRDWLHRNNYIPDKLIAVYVKGDSMEPGIYDGDTVVINTSDPHPSDGDVFAVNYEGELLIKRLTRDMGEWWLTSDNPDQRKHPRKLCSGDMCIVIGKVIQKQSTRI